MPLLTSPIDGSPMKQIKRFGIELDVCPTTGGIWLDKGELEKLMAMIREAAAEEQENYSPQNAGQPVYQEPPRQQNRAVYEEPRYQQPPQQQYYKRDDDDDRHRYQSQGHYGKHGHYKKKSKFSDILDIFDF
jgi:Zn-finger nucleic acid-binding protein